MIFIILCRFWICVSGLLHSRDGQTSVRLPRHFLCLIDLTQGLLCLTPFVSHGRVEHPLGIKPLVRSPTAKLSSVRGPAGGTVGFHTLWTGQWSGAEALMVQTLVSNTGFGIIEYLRLILKAYFCFFGH